MLEIENLHAQVADNEILRGVNLTVKSGEVHAIMGPNGSGKSTLAGILAGRDAYTVTSGHVRYDNQDLLDMEPEARAREGIFLAFQYPVEIPGVNVVVTHYQRLLNYIVPDYVHVLSAGRVVKSGGKDLALELEEKGYRWTEENV